MWVCSSGEGLGQQCQRRTQPQSADRSSWGAEECLSEKTERNTKGRGDRQTERQRQPKTERSQK